MFIFCNYNMFIIVMVLSCYMVNCITCMFYFLCEEITVMKINKFLCLVTLILPLVYGIVFINNGIVNKHIIRLFYIFEALLVLSLLTTSVVYWFICFDMLLVLLNVVLSNLFVSCFQHKKSEIYNCCEYGF